MTPRRALVAALALLAGCGARSELSPSAPAPDRLACGLADVHARAGRGVELIASVPPRLEGHLAWTLLGAPSPAQLTPTGVDRARFWTNTEGTYRVRVEGAVPSARTERCEINVVVRGTAPGATCPAEVVAIASTPVTLRGTAESAAPITQDRWVLEAAPSGSAHPPMRRDGPFGASFVPDVVGEYVARLEVTDAQGETDRCATRVRALPGPGLRVELWWNPPRRQCPSAAEASCDRADLDLHMLRLPASRGWGSQDDCHFATCNIAAGQSLAWGASGVDDDPRLLRDDVSGHGPEIVAVPSPAGARYRVGVHYFAARGADAQNAFIAVYCNGVTVFLGPALLPTSGLDGGAFWPVADITPGDAGCAIEAIGPDGGARVVAWDDVQGNTGS